MATALFFTGGGEVKVTADFEDVERFLAQREPARFARFAGFRGDDPVGAEALVVRPDAVAYAQALTRPGSP